MASQTSQSPIAAMVAEAETTASNNATSHGGVAGFLLQGKPPARVMLETPQGFFTFGELDSAARKVAAFLLKSGARRGNRILLVAQNSYFWVVSYLGILRAGLVCVPLPASISGQDLAFITQSTDSNFACADAEFILRN